MSALGSAFLKLRSAPAYALANSSDSLNTRANKSAIFFLSFGGSGRKFVEFPYERIYRAGPALLHGF